MDEFGSPLAGGIRAVRRNISSSFLGAPKQAQADPVTTDLLQQQSLSLTSISQQLQSVSGQISRFDSTLQGVKEKTSRVTYCPLFNYLLIQEARMNR